MDIEKIKKWLEITNEYRQSNFWSSVLQQKTPDDFFRNKEQEQKPIYDLLQNEYYNFVIIEIPGINREDLTLNLLSKSQLLIEGTSKPLFPMEKELKRERTYGNFKRIIELAEATDPQLLNIQVYNGLLLISYPRQVEYVNLKH